MKLPTSKSSDSRALGKPKISYRAVFVNYILRYLRNFTQFIDFGGESIYTLLRAKVAEQKKLRNLTNKDIAKMTGYTKSTIDAFMCGVRESDKVAKAIATALGIEL